MLGPSSKAGGNLQHVRRAEKYENGGVNYFKLPQKRWIRRQASSRSSVLVA